MGVDYLDYKNKTKNNFFELTENTKIFIHNLEERLGKKINLIGTGPKDDELFETNWG